MQGMTKTACKTFESLVETELTKVLGAPLVNKVLGWKTWEMPHGATGRVTFDLICDSLKPGRDYRFSWLATRITDTALIGEDGYMRPGARHPYPYADISGKNNMMPRDRQCPEAMRRELAHFLATVAPIGSPEYVAFGNMPFDIAA